MITFDWRDFPLITQNAVFVLQTPHLVNLNEDPLMSECLLYYIKEGITRFVAAQYYDTPHTVMMSQIIRLMDVDDICVCVPGLDSRTWTSSCLATSSKKFIVCL